MGIIGSAISGIGSIFGGITGAIAMNKTKKRIEEQREKNQNWYDRRYNEDATQRADAQRILSMTEEAIKNRNRQASGTSAVMGGTNESVATAKATNADVIANINAQIAAAGDARKDNIEATYQQRDDQYVDALNQSDAYKANQIAGAVRGLGEAAKDMNVLDDLLPLKK